MKTNCSDCCYPQLINPEACGCCEGVEIITPLSIYNRPGLSDISYRIGTHSSFLETMTARLTGYYLEKKDAEGNSQKIYPLQGLSTRNSDDPALAMLDAWAVVADVLTFYQERIANEGYLRTATERRSVLEMARLVGYKPRPGVSSSVFLAYTLDENFEGETVIPVGSRSQSIPGPDELPLSFETSEGLKARMQWNNLKPRMTQAQTRKTIEGSTEPEIKLPRIYLKGINTNLKINDPLLIDFGSGNPDFYWVREVLPNAKAEHTLVNLYKNEISKPVFKFKVIKLVEMIHNLTIPASIQPVNALQLKQGLIGQFIGKRKSISDSQKIFRAAAQPSYLTLGSFSAILDAKLTTAVKNVELVDNIIKVYALRANASLFGYNAPKEPQYEPATHIPSGSEFPVVNPNAGNLKPQPWPEWEPDIGSSDADVIDESNKILYLDKSYQEILPNDFIIVQSNNNATNPAIFTVVNTNTISRHAYGLGGETTKVEISGDWWNPSDELDIRKIRTTKVFAQPEQLKLAEEPITAAVCGGGDEKNIIELDDFYDGLEAGRWVIISGEREDLSGVRFSELAMLSSVTQGSVEESRIINDLPVALPVEKSHTFIQLAEKLAYCFKRDTVTIHGNVIKATHGETRHEILGSGNGAKPFQSFELKQFPLTHVSASNPTGIDSTLKLYVNDIQWDEADSLAGLEANDRQFISKTNNEDNTTVIFGNGKKGARLPTGIENIRAEYRNGIGKPGNVKAEQISLLMDKPLGVKEVINPLQASSGANRETRDQARKHVPLAVKALDRLVSIQDYEDFSRIYAGIGKAHAVELSNGRQQLVHVTIAGAENVPIDQSSDMFRNLRRALHDFGDPHQAIQLAVHELKFIVIEAGVAILPEYQWEPVVTDLRERLLEAFSFERRELGQNVMLSEVIHVMQSVRGVAYVDVDSFGGVPEKIENTEGSRRLLTPDEISEVVSCLATRWNHDDMDAFCANNSDTGGTDFDECNKFESCQKYGHFGGTRGVRQLLQVNLAKFEQDGFIRPAQIAFLTPDVPATLILNQIERLP